ncbi:MAG: lipopolysaccharide heptosyltransferase II [Gemmatimonadota bacterium]
MTSSLVIQTSFIGDVVLTTPLLTQLAHRGPVDVVTTPASAGLLANHPSVRTVIVYDKRGADRGVHGFLSLAKRLRHTQYDAALLAQGSWRSAALALFARIPSRLGFSTSSGRLFYTKRVLYDARLHHAARLLMLARPNGREPSAEEMRPSLHPGEPERLSVDMLLTAAGIGREERLIALAPGSVWATKRWPYFPELAASLSVGARIVVVGGAADGELAAAIVAAAPGALDATGKLSLLASAELVGRSSVLVTNDSAPEHFASAMGTPTVAIFGPTVPAFGFGPLAPRSVVVEHDAMPCRPCSKHGPQVCPLGHHRCMTELSVERVEAAVRAVTDR